MYEAKVLPTHFQWACGAKLNALLIFCPPGDLYPKFSGQQNMSYMLPIAPLYAQPGKQNMVLNSPCTNQTYEEEHGQFSDCTSFSNPGVLWCTILASPPLILTQLPYYPSFIFLLISSNSLSIALLAGGSDFPPFSLASSSSTCSLIPMP